MRNGTRFSPGKLVLVNEDSRDADWEDAAADARQPYLTAPDGAGLLKPSPLLILVSVSVACAAAAIVTGSYAFWLARHQAAHQALTDVNDLLKSCQSRMQQLEADVQRLPLRER